MVYLPSAIIYLDIIESAVISPYHTALQKKHVNSRQQNILRLSDYFQVPKNLGVLKRKEYR